MVQRMYYSNGRMIPIPGDAVYQHVGSAFGEAIIEGVVYEVNSSKKLRVRVTGGTTMGIGSIPIGKTFPLTEYWIVDGDPWIKKRDAEKKRESDEKSRKEREISKFESKINELNAELEKKGKRVHSFSSLKKGDVIAMYSGWPGHEPIYFEYRFVGLGEPWPGSKLTPEDLAEGIQLKPERTSHKVTLGKASQYVVLKRSKEELFAVHSSRENPFARDTGNKTRHVKYLPGKHVIVLFLKDGYIFKGNKIIECSDTSKKHEIPNKHYDLKRFYVEVKNVKKTSIENIYNDFQRENVRLNDNQALSRTTMCVGDAILSGNTLHVVNNRGFIKIKLS